MVVGRALPWKHQTSVAHEQDDVQQTPLEFDASLYRVKEVVGLEVSRTAIRGRNKHNFGRIRRAVLHKDGHSSACIFIGSAVKFKTSTDHSATVVQLIRRARGASLSASPSVSNALSSAASPSGAAGTTPIKLKPILHLDATIATNNRPAKFLCVQPPPDEQGQRHLQTGLSAMWPSEAQTSASLLLFRPSSRRSRHELMPSSRAA
uniref:Uncharacterized protein n=1 Tax=Globodera pallida TaxID=36090 RepID=A0A183C5G2_GLOPA